MEMHVEMEFLHTDKPQLVFFLFFLFLLICLLYLQYYHKKKKPQLQKPNKMLPSPARLPIIGHLHLLNSKMPLHHVFADLARRLGPIFQLQLGQVPTVVISSPSLARQVLTTHDHVFASRPQLVAARYLSFNCSDITFSPYGPYWRQARKICVAELLSPRRVGLFAAIREGETARLIGHLVGSCPGSAINMTDLFFAHANNVLCRAAFGKRFIVEEQGCRLMTVLAETQALFAGFTLGDFFPRWERVLSSVTRLKLRLERNLRNLSEVCDEIILEHARKKQILHQDEQEDFLDVLLRLKQRDDLEVPITDDNLKALVLDMFVAGTDTTAATMEWTMMDLTKHPRVMRKVQEEVRKNAIPRKGNRGKDEVSADFRDLPYMKAVIKEAMRLHPPVPLLVPRESMERCVLNGYEVPAKTRVLINTYALGRDGESWDNPTEFNPERFEDGRIEIKDQDFRLLPFGGGRRGCPGFSFGLATVETTLAQLLYHFDWALPHDATAGSIDESEIFGLATRKKQPLVLVPTQCTSK